MSNRQKGYSREDKQCAKCMWLIDWLHFLHLREKHKPFHSAAVENQEHGKWLDCVASPCPVERLFINNTRQHKQGEIRKP